MSKDKTSVGKRRSAGTRAGLQAPTQGAHAHGEC